MSDQFFKAIADGDCKRLTALTAVGKGIEVTFGSDKWNLLHLALVSLTASPKPEVVRHLIELGVDVNARDWRRWTPLHFAVRTKNIDVVKHLIMAGSEIDAANDEGLSPLHLYLTKAPVDLNMIDILLAAGADPDKDQGSGTVRHYVEVISDPDSAAILGLFDKYTKASGRKKP